MLPSQSTAPPHSGEGTRGFVPRRDSAGDVEGSSPTKKAEAKSWRIRRRFLNISLPLFLAPDAGGPPHATSKADNTARTWGHLVRMYPI